MLGKDEVSGGTFQLLKPPAVNQVNQLGLRLKTSVTSRSRLALMLKALQL